jgi:hypothetical protein
MDFLLDALAADSFSAVAHLPDLDLVGVRGHAFTYWHIEAAEAGPELAEPTIEDAVTSQAEGAGGRSGTARTPAGSAAGRDRDGGHRTGDPRAVLLVVRVRGVRSPRLGRRLDAALPAGLEDVPLAELDQLAGQPGGSERGRQYVPPTQSGLGAARIGYS